MKKTKFLAAAMAAVLAVSLCGCNNETGGRDDRDESVSTKKDKDKESKEESKEESKPTVEYVTPGEDEFDYEFDSEAGGNVITGYNGTEKNITIPDTIDGDKVVDFRFGGNSDIEYVRIPDGFTKIGYNAFGGCKNLKGVEIPDSVTKIVGFEEWEGYEYYENYIRQGRISIVEDYDLHCAFTNCDSLESINIPDSVTEIGLGVFFSCDNLKSINIPNGVTEIGDYVFYSCTSLTSIDIPDSVTEIGDFAFFGCTSLTSVTIPNSVTGIGGAAFYGCTSLTSIDIPDSVTKIGNGAFAGCTSLTSIDIPDSVTTIGMNAFAGCKKAKITYKGNTYDCNTIEAAING